MERVARLHVLIGYTLLARHDPSGAAETIERGLRLYQELDQPAGIALALGAWATLEQACDHHERAARLFGAAAAPRDVLLAWLVNPANRVIQDRQVQRARARYAGTPLEAAWAAGEAMSLDEAVQFVTG
jgi:non-specific serine/threonine protein kinase